jgi:hypothetical protein
MKNEVTFKIKFDSNDVNYAKEVMEHVMNQEFQISLVDDDIIDKFKIIRIEKQNLSAPIELLDVDFDNVTEAKEDTDPFASY